MPTFRCAHISDLHFAKPTWDLSQFFSKRWLGNLNLLVARKQTYTTQHLPPLIDLFTQLDVSHVLITGDLSTTSAEAEFAAAQEFIEKLKRAGLTVYAVPGNHDHYTRQACRDQVFYQFFEGQYDPFCSYHMKKQRLTIAPLSANWSALLLDTALATSLISSCGLFSETLEKHLEEALGQLPKEHQVMLVNHFPFFDNDSPRKKLIRGSALRKVIERFPQIRLYLHGHTHRHCIADLRASHLPIVLDSGSTSHHQIGTWNLIEISEKNCLVQPYSLQHNAERTSWAPHRDPHCFTWEKEDVGTLV